MSRFLHPRLKHKRREGALRLCFRRGFVCVLLAALGAEPAQNRELPPPPGAPALGAESPKSYGLPSAPAVAPALTAAPTAPIPPPPPVILRPGETVTLRILQVLPADGLSPGERLLNSRNPILPGDRFLAEVIEPHCNGPALVGGSVAKVVRPGWFGRPGYVTLQLAQLIQTVDGKSQETSWQLDTQDRQVAARMRRVLLSALITSEWAVVGASAGAQDLALHNGMAVGGAAAVGTLLGFGFASLQRGIEGSLEPGDTFRIVVGTMKYQLIPKDWQTILYPASDPEKRKPRR